MNRGFGGFSKANSGRAPRQAEPSYGGEGSSKAWIARRIAGSGTSYGARRNPRDVAVVVPQHAAEAFPAGEATCEALPGDDCLGLDDDQGPHPARPQPSEQDPKRAVAGSKPRLLPIPLVNRELLAKRHVLHCKVRPDTQERPEQDDERRYQCPHWIWKRITESRQVSSGRGIRGFAEHDSAADVRNSVHPARDASDRA